jgi:hypothetical protein
MNKLLIAALALGAASFVNSAVSAPAAARLTPDSEGIVQKADDRDRDLKDDRSDQDRRGDWWGRAPTWRDTRPWSDDEWRRGPDWYGKGPGPDED